MDAMPRGCCLCLMRLGPVLPLPCLVAGLALAAAERVEGDGDRDHGTDHDLLDER